MINRRGFLTGLGAALAAPAIVPYTNLMPVRSLNLLLPCEWRLAQLKREGFVYAYDPMRDACGAVQMLDNGAMLRFMNALRDGAIRVAEGRAFLLPPELAT